MTPQSRENMLTTPYYASKENVRRKYHNGTVFVKIDLTNQTFWNINGRWATIGKTFMSSTCNIVLLSETQCNMIPLPKIIGCKIIADSNVPELSSRSSFAGYMNVNLYNYITHILFSKCTFSLHLLLSPSPFY